MIRYVIWDWNGTLLDDVDSCVDVLNEMLLRRGLQQVSRMHYRERFGFPVRSFYQGLGFDVSEQAFVDLSTEFIASYKQVLVRVGLHAGALDVMKRLGGVLDGQLVVSAMEHNMLGRMLSDYGVLPHLRAHQGTINMQASSKVQVGVEVVQALRLDPQQVLLVGDTEHDLELAEALGCHCVLHVGGHQTRERLQATGCPVVDDLHSVVQLVESRCIPG